MAAYALWYLALVELRGGNFALADEYAEQCRQPERPVRARRGGVAASLFPSDARRRPPRRPRRARELAERSWRLAELHAARLQAPLATARAGRALVRDAEPLPSRFAAAEEVEDAADGAEPAMSWWRAEQVEALLELGLVDEAVVRLDAWEAAARRLDRDWALAHATRCRGLVAAARGDVGRRCACLSKRSSSTRRRATRSVSARALLALGVTRRRAREKRQAREAIELALAGFEELGADGWTERARGELGAIGGRTRSEGLTPAEQRVADLVAKGRTNAEVAATLFLAERTVASHLTHVYAKLGVRSRTELARKLADGTRNVPAI